MIMADYEVVKKSRLSTMSWQLFLSTMCWQLSPNVKGVPKVIGQTPELLRNEARGGSCEESYRILT